MANLKNTQYFTMNPTAWGKKLDTLVTVGNNRQIRLAEHEGRLMLTGYLHGSPVATFELVKGGLEIFLNPCGYLTVTTRAAMQDFARAMGMRGGVSISKGVLSASWIKGSYDANPIVRGEFKPMPTGQIIATIALKDLGE